eukprot:2995304-Amphidinium_carterae.1
MVLILQSLLKPQTHAGAKNTAAQHSTENVHHEAVVNRGSEQTGNSLNITFIRLLRSSAQHFSPLQVTCNRAMRSKQPNTSMGKPRDHQTLCIGAIWSFVLSVTSNVAHGVIWQSSSALLRFGGCGDMEDISLNIVDFFKRMVANPGRHCGKTGTITVISFPKSGRTWLIKMMRAVEG